MAGGIVFSTVDHICPLVLGINSHPKSMCVMLGCLLHLQFVNVYIVKIINWQCACICQVDGIAWSCERC